MITSHKSDNPDERPESAAQEMLNTVEPQMRLLEAVSQHTLRPWWKPIKKQKPLYTDRERVGRFETLATEIEPHFREKKVGVYNTLEGIVVVSAELADLHAPYTLILFYRDSKAMEMYQYTPKGKIFEPQVGTYSVVNVFGGSESLDTIGFRELGLPRGDVILNGLDEKDCIPIDQLSNG